MARENQALQIALITFVILTLLLGVTTYLFFRQYDEQFKKTQAALEGGCQCE
jgi:preprotein translocase subunit YajC